MLERQHMPEHWEGAFGKIGIVHRTCPLCEHDNGAQPASRYSHDIWEIKNCSRCGFVYIEKAPDYEELFANMAWERTTKVEEQRRASIRPFSYGFSKRTRWRMHILPRKKMHLLIEAYAKPGNVIDLGCGNGMVMAKLADGFVPFGVEISTHFARSADQFFGTRGGRAINAPSLEGLKQFPDGFFSAASLRSYLEHEMKPVAVLGELHRTLEPGGIAMGRLAAFRTPGGHRRIRREDLILFMRENELPMPPEFERGSGLRKVLIVDDESQIRKSLSEHLTTRQRPYEVLTAADGFEAGRLVATFRPDVVLLDLRMSGLDGFQVCRTIKADPGTANTIVISMTGYHSPEAEARILECGAIRCSSKPIEASKISEFIDAELERPSGSKPKRGRSARI